MSTITALASPAPISGEPTPQEHARRVYADLLIKEWWIPEGSHRLHGCVRRVLCEMQSESLLTLRNNPKLEVVVCRNAPYTVFAYFPMHRRRRILRVLKFVPRPETKVLLVLSEPAISEQDVHVTENQLRDHLGHTLLYLRDPGARNECADAQREWRDATR